MFKENRYKKLLLYLSYKPYGFGEDALFIPIKKITHFDGSYSNTVHCNRLIKLVMVLCITMKYVYMENVRNFIVHTTYHILITV